VAIIPLLMIAEFAARLEPPVIPVTTSITIDAPASVVWKNVISFPPLAPPSPLSEGLDFPDRHRLSGLRANCRIGRRSHPILPLLNRRLRRTHHGLG